MSWNKLASGRRAAGSDEALGAVVGPVIGAAVVPIFEFPWLLIVAPGSRMKVTPLPENMGVPVIFRVPEMKYTPDRVMGALSVMWTLLFVHGVAAV